MEQLAEMQDSDAGTESADEPIETTQADTSTSPDDSTESTSEAEGSLLETEADDDEEIDYDGEKYKVPKKLRDAFLRQQDYTQKTQTVAEQRKEVEARQQQLAAQAQAQQQHLAEYAEAYSLDSQLKQFANVDWNALIDTDPVQAMKLDRQYKELQQRRDSIVSTVTQKQQQAHEQMQRENAKRIAEGQAVLAREIKGWSPEVAKELVSFGREIGYAPEELNSISDPRSVKLLHKAWQFDQLMKKQATPKDKPAPQEKPVTRITASKGTATKDPDKMSTNEWLKWRNAQIKNR